MTGETQEKSNQCDDDKRSPPDILQIEEYESSTLSSITPQVTGTLKKIGEQQQSIEMGLPPTPLLQTLKMPDLSFLEEGYDSDMQIGPFYQDGVHDEGFVIMDEDALEEPESILLPDNAAENVKNLSPVMLTDEQINGMKVLELRQELEKQGMSKNGLKSVLVERLKEAVRNNVKLIKARPDHEVENIAGDGFDGNAYWKYLEQTGAEIDESAMEVEGITFRAPTTSEAEHNSDFQDRPKKRNYAETFDHAPFVAERLLPQKNLRGQFRKDRNGNFIYKKQPTTETVPNLEYLFTKGIGLESHPADWFELFFPRNRNRLTCPKAVTLDDLTAWTNTKAVINNAGAGGGKYKGFVNFLSTEIMAHLGLYLLHSVAPSPQIEYKFASKNDKPVNASNLCHSVFGKSGTTRHK